MRIISTLLAAMLLLIIPQSFLTKEFLRSHGPVASISVAAVHTNSQATTTTDKTKSSPGWGLLKRKVVFSIAIKEYSMSRDSTRQLSPSFKVREFACKGSNVVLLDDELVVLLQCIREHFGKPVHITSGYRTAAHNAAVGGSKSSQHLLGRAADFYVEGGRCGRLRRDPAASPGRHRALPEGRKASQAQHRLGAYRYPGE